MKALVIGATGAIVETPWKSCQPERAVRFLCSFSTALFDENRAAFAITA